MARRALSGLARQGRRLFGVESAHPRLSSVARGQPGGKAPVAPMTFLETTVAASRFVVQAFPPKRPSPVRNRWLLGAHTDRRTVEGFVLAAAAGGVVVVGAPSWTGCCHGRIGRRMGAREIGSPQRRRRRGNTRVRATAPGNSTRRMLATGSLFGWRVCMGSYPAAEVGLDQGLPARQEDR
jgi:hypothetical protein